MIMEIAALPPAAVEGDKVSFAAKTLAGWPTLTYAPTNHRQREQAIDERMTGLLLPTLSMKKT